MKANELRIGNYVKEEETGAILTCVGYDPRESQFWLESKDENKGWFDFEPIPLTDGWLVKFGFEQEHFGDPVYFLNNDIDFVVDLHEREVTWKNQIYKDSYCNHPLPEYVHQLQNLYFVLTGQELTIQ